MAEVAPSPEPPRPMYRLTLEALPGPAAPEVRLRRVLKALLRSYRFRCLEVVLAKPTAPVKKESTP